METVPVQPLVQLEELARFWTVDDLDSLEYVPGYRYELVDGILVVSPGPAYDHEIAGAILRAAIHSVLPAGFLPVGPADVVLGRRSVRMPDIMVAEIATMRGKQRLTPADVRLVIEIVSPSSMTTDRITKPAQYAAAGIPYFWRVEIDPVSLTAYELDGETYRESGSWAAGDTARIDAPFPIEIDVAALLPDA